jgi:hypothetical protein
MQPLTLISYGLALGLAIGVAAQQAATARATYVDPTYKFTIQAPAFPKVAADGMVIPVSFQAPPQDGFGPNVNVIVQPLKTTRKDFRDSTAAQFEQAGIELKSERMVTVSGREAVDWDYENELQGRRLRFLQRAIIAEDRVLIATCTAPAEAFPKYEAAFRQSLASFKLQSPPVVKKKK